MPGARRPRPEAARGQTEGSAGAARAAPARTARLSELHTHTTASDGQLAPAALVERAMTAGIRVLGVTDHDTTAGVAAAAAAGAAAGVTVVPGIEVTAVLDARDVHVLGYFVDPGSVMLAEFLSRQRADRVRRAHRIGDRLRELGSPIDIYAQVAVCLQGNGQEPAT